MAAGNGGKTYGEWSQVSVNVNGVKVTLETDLAEDKMKRKLRRLGLAPTSAKYNRSNVSEATKLPAGRVR